MVISAPDDFPFYESPYDFDRGMFDDLIYGFGLGRRRRPYVLQICNAKREGQATLRFDEIVVWEPHRLPKRKPSLR